MKKISQTQDMKNYKNLMENHSTHYTDSSFPILFHNNIKKPNQNKNTQRTIFLEGSISSNTEKRTDQIRQPSISYKNVSINSDKFSDKIKQSDHSPQNFYANDMEQMRKYIGRAQNINKLQMSNLNKSKDKNSFFIPKINKAENITTNRNIKSKTAKKVIELQTLQIPKIQRIRQIYINKNKLKNNQKSIEVKGNKQDRQLQTQEKQDSQKINLTKITEDSHQQQILRKNNKKLGAQRSSFSSKNSTITFQAKNRIGRYLEKIQKASKLENNNQMKKQSRILPDQKQNEIETFFSMNKESLKICPENNRYNDIQDQIQLPAVNNFKYTIKSNKKSQKEPFSDSKVDIVSISKTQKASLQSEMIQKRVKELEDQHQKQIKLQTIQKATQMENQESLKQQFIQVPSVRNIIIQNNNQQKSLKKQKNSNYLSNEERINQFIQCFKPHTDIFKNLDISTFTIRKYKNGVYFGELKNTQDLKQNPIKQGFGCIFYYNGRLYQGKFLNDLKHGRGFELYPDGSFYQGNFEAGLKSGKGRFVWSNGEIYDGQWQKGKKHGSGMWKNSSIQPYQSYIGQWYQGKVEGFGVKTSSKGDRYEGQFKNSLKHGVGTQRFQNGDVYVGKYQKGRQNGYGQIYYKNGDIFKGELCNNLKHGKGVYIDAKTGDIFEGDYQNDKKCGQGTYKWSNGDIYTGNFENGIKHGYGELTTNQGTTIYKGYWINGKMLKDDEKQDLLKNRIDLIPRLQSQQKRINKIPKFHSQKKDNRALENIKSKSRSPQEHSSHNNLHQRNCGCNKIHKWRF